MDGNCVRIALDAMGGDNAPAEQADAESPDGELF